MQVILCDDSTDKGPQICNTDLITNVIKGPPHLQGIQSGGSIHISYIYSQHVVVLTCTDQNVNNQTLTQVSQLYVHVSLCRKVIRSWLNLLSGGHGHVICMCDLHIYS